MPHRPTPEQDADWSVVIPVKGGPTAKSRLALDPTLRAEVAESLARHTVGEAVRAPGVHEVLVVTGDDRVAQAFRSLGVRVVPESVASLAAAIRDGLAAVARHRPMGRTAVLLGDLPAVTAADLGAVLALGTRAPRSYVPDTEGTGTVLLLAERAGLVCPRFGPGSARAHEAAGHRRLDLVASLGVSVAARVRRDADTVAHLDAALTLRGTARVAASVRTLGHGPRRW